MKKLILLAMCVGYAAASPAFAETLNSSNTTNATTTANTQASNLGNNLTNNFNSPSDTHEHISGMTGSNTAVGLGSFSSSFSSDYCGGVAQGGVSAPYITIAAGKPVLGDPGVACVLTRAAVHSMEFSVTFGTAAAVANKAGNTALAQSYTDMSMKLAKASVNMLCDLSDDVRKSFRDAGVECPATQQELADQQKAKAVADNEPTDPLIRRRLGLAPLVQVASK